MKVQSYFALTCSILVLGTAFGYYYHLAIRNPKVLSEKSELLIRFQERTARYAAKAVSGPIAEWQVYSSLRETTTQPSDLIVVQGIDGQERPVFKVVFHKDTGVPLRMMRMPRKDHPLKEVSGKPPREVAAWWLSHIGMETEGKWLWVQDGMQTQKRYQSYWRNVSCNASITVNTETGYLVTLGLDETNPGTAQPEESSP